MGKEKRAVSLEDRLPYSFLDLFHFVKNRNKPRVPGVLYSNLLYFEYRYFTGSLLNHHFLSLLRIRVRLNLLPMSDCF